MVQLVLSCLAIFGLYLAYLHGNTTGDRPPVTTDDAHRQQVMRYLLTDHPDVVFVGTSLSYAFKPDYFSAEGYHNLSFPGGSAVTGLRVIAESGILPRTLIIETNILGVKPDERLVEYFRPTWPILNEPRRLIRDFKPIRTFLCQVLHVDPSSDTMHKKPLPPGTRRAYYQRHKADLMAGAPVDHDVSAAVAKALSGHSTPEFLGTVYLNAREIVETANDLERRGVTVYLLDMPLMPEIAIDWYSSAASRAIREANAGREDRWLPLDLDRSQLRWGDAYHLDERSNMFVIDAIEKKLKEDASNHPNL